MTAQTTDKVLLRDQPYSLVALDGVLFEPGSHGLHPVMISTGNWLGFSCTYRVEEERLYLDNVVMGFNADDLAATGRGEGPRLFGVAPVLDEGGYQVIYRDLHQAMAYTGTLVLGTDFVWDLYVHMGFHPPWKYRVVIDLTFKDGQLTQEIDRSADMARLRDAMASGGLESLFKPLSPTP